MIDILIFSKDRACQLDLLLRSIKDNFKEIKNNITIICKGSNEDYIKGYLKLSKKFPLYTWKGETDLVQDIKLTVKKFIQDFSMCFVDDEIVIRDYSIKPFLKVLNEDNDVHCGTLRLGRNIGNYCYTADLHSTIPDYESTLENDIYKWEWRLGDQRTDLYYSSCINSHIYRTDFFKYWIDKLDFNNVNSLEGMLNNERESFKKYMICGKVSKTINIANNLSQSGTNRHSNKQEYSLKSLNDKYLEGYIIDEKKFYNMVNDKATFESDYELIEE